MGMLYNKIQTNEYSSDDSSQKRSKNDHIQNQSKNDLIMNKLLRHIIDDDILIFDRYCSSAIYDIPSNTELKCDICNAYLLTRYLDIGVYLTGSDVVYHMVFHEECYIALYKEIEEKNE
jgi:hypothetical protein